MCYVWGDYSIIENMFLGNNSYDYTSKYVFQSTKEKTIRVFKFPEQEMQDLSFLDARRLLRSLKDQRYMKYEPPLFGSRHHKGITVEEERFIHNDLNIVRPGLIVFETFPGMSQKG